MNKEIKDKVCNIVEKQVLKIVEHEAVDKNIDMGKYTEFVAFLSGVLISTASQVGEIMVYDGSK